jgi:hypothetical protein
MVKVKRRVDAGLGGEQARNGANPDLNWEINKQRVGISVISAPSLRILFIDRLSIKKAAIGLSNAVSDTLSLINLDFIPRSALHIPPQAHLNSTAGPARTRPRGFLF